MFYLTCTKVEDTPLSTFCAGELTSFCAAKAAVESVKVFAFFKTNIVPLLPLNKIMKKLTLINDFICFVIKILKYQL